MKLKRPKVPQLSKLKIAGKEHHEKLQEHIRKLPKSGEELGKSIEKKLSASQKVWSNVGVALFSSKALENVSHFSSFLLGMTMLILTDLVLIFPTDKDSLALSAMINNFFIVLAGLLVANAITYIAMRAIGSKTRFKVFFSTVNTAMFMSLLVIAIPAALVSFALFSTMLRSQAAINLFFSIIPFYNYLIYGWASEGLSKLRGIKSVLVALAALIIILFTNLLLGQFMA